MEHYLSPLEYLYRWEAEIPDKVYLREPVNDRYHELTWKETGQEVRKMAGYLKSLNLPEKSRIAILSKNCAHWVITDLAIMMAGHIAVPLYPNLTADTLGQIITHSESELIFVGKLDNYEDMKAGISGDLPCISFPFYPREEHLQWNNLVSEVKPVTENLVMDPNDTATIIYTSGTTGMPKGVMHRFYNFAFVSHWFLQKDGLNMRPGEQFFSYLPLCHIAEKILVQMGSLSVGGVISFAESLNTFSRNMQDAELTVFLAVPRIWTKFEQAILAKIPLKKLRFYLSVPILSGIIKRKISKNLGLQHARHIFTGAAPIPPTLLEFFARLDIHIQEAYAMTENCCYSHVNRKDNIKIGTVGQPFPPCEVQISKEGEILIKHEAIMTGYFKEPGITAETFTEDGFLRTGDEGSIDEEGFLKITGRVKDLFKSSKGKYIAPAPIELILLENDDFDQVCVVGNGIPQPIALAVLTPEKARKSEAELSDSLNKTLKSVNQRLDHHEMLAKLVILREEWNIENGLLTPTLKVKRKMIDQKYSSHYESWSEKEGGKVTWV